MPASVFALGLALGVALLAGCGSDGPLGPAGSRSSAIGAYRGPVPASYTVKRGDTLALIAGRFGLGVGELARLNRLSDPDHIRVGQVLRLPQSQAQPGFASGPALPPPDGAVATAVALPQAQPQPQPIPQPVPSAVTAGTQPAFSRSVAVLSLDALPAQTSPAPPPVSAAPAQTDLPSAPSAAAIPEPASRDPLPPATGKIQPAPARPSGGGRFAWPADGRIISGFGSQEGGLHNDGINIAAPRGATVRAAEGGVVAYAGNELRGFGNLVLVRHQDGWVTAYAHLERMIVARGDTVRRGQQIGTVGSTGSVTTPQLHFEVRRGRRAADPQEFLAPRSGVTRAAVPAGPPGPG